MLSRELIVDATGVINLAAVQISEACLESIEPKPQVTLVVETVECRGKPKTAEFIGRLLEQTLLERCDVEISSDEVLAFMAANDIGAGESEAILACKATARHFWCDDRRARDIAAAELGAQAVTGTIGVLKDLVRFGCLTAEEAFEAYTEMLSEGAFLPVLARADFEGERA